MQALIQSIGIYVPSKRVSNDELAKTIDTTDEWIVSHTGIRYRHFAAEDEAASDLGVNASKIALERAGLKPEDIDMVLVTSSSGDYPDFPSTACIIQDKIGAKNAGAVDMLAGCTGFIYALETAKNYILAGSAKNILVIGTEILTRVTNWKDRNTCVLFGDAAGAVVVQAGEDGNRGIKTSVLRSDGSGADYLLRKAGGSRNPFKPGETDPTDLLLYMDGRRVYNFAVKVIIDTINTLLKNNNMTIDDIKYIVPHQANRRIIEAAAKRSKIPVEKFFMVIDEYANTSTASIPLALHTLVEKGLLKKGDPIITVGFGAGLTYGGNLIYW